MYAFNSLNGAPAVALRRPATQQSTSGGGGRHSLGYRHEPSRRLDGGAAPLQPSSSLTLPAAWSDNGVLPSTLPANRATHISSNHTIPEAQPQLRPSTRGCIGVSRELIPNGIPNNTSPHHSTIREEAATNTTTNIDHRWMRTRPSTTTTTTGTPPVTPREGGGMVVLSARDAAAAAERDRHRAELDASWQKCTRLHTALQDQKLEAKRLSRELSCAAHMLIDRDEVVARQAITIDELTLRNTLLLSMLASWYASHPVCVVKEQVAAPPLPPPIPPPPPPTDVVVVSSPPQIVVTIRDSQLLRALRAAESAVDSLKREVQKRDASWDVMEWDRRQLLAPPPSTTSSTIPVFLASTMPSGWATTAAASFSASGAAACSAGVEHHTISNKIGGNLGSEGGMSTALLLASSSEQRRRPMTQPGGTRRRPTR